MSGDASLPAARRVKRQRDFRSAYGRGQRASGAWLTVVVLRRRSESASDAGDARVGLSVSRQHGGAVRRNKIKRLLREAFRLERHALPAGIDVVLIPKQRDERWPLAELRRELPQLVHKALSRPAGQRRRRAPRSPS